MFYSAGGDKYFGITVFLLQPNSLRFGWFWVERTALALFTTESAGTWAVHNAVQVDGVGLC